jgi:regulatory protein
MIELMKSGVKGEVAKQALDDVYDSHDTLAVARQLAQKQAPPLRKLDPQVARRRLTGMLLRRGFDYEDVRPVIDEVLGSSVEVLDE